MGPNVASRMLDLSETGVRLIIKEALKKGEEVEVEIDKPGGQKSQIRKGTVEWSVPTSDNEHCVGIQFDKPLEYRFFSELIKF